MATDKQTKRKPTGAAAMGAGPGRPKGSVNKLNGEVKAMILEALEGVGGSAYLMERASDPRTASAFMALVGKVLPLQISGDAENPLAVVGRIELVALSK